MGGEGKESYAPLFETKVAKGKRAYKVYAVSVLLGICLICCYRISHVPATTGSRLGWIILFLSELWFTFYWFLSQFVRWNPIYRSTFTPRLSQRYEKVLPRVDIFVCTADATIEPPLMVINTVLSVMAYDYPPDKLGVYLSDDGASELTFYALVEASRFSEHWLPFCKKFKVEPRSPEAYFSLVQEPSSFLDDPLFAKDWSSIKNLYEDMKGRVETSTRRGRLSESAREEDKGFHEWDSISTGHDHQAIIQILIDGREAVLDIESQLLPTLVYVAREKRPQYHHNFKAGAMNALIRVSSEITNGSVILNVDCDMHSNNSEAIRDAMCFFMDEAKGREIAYVQFPQNYSNLTMHDIYSSCFRVPNELEMGGLDANGGPCYIGSGCFHRRDTLCGAKNGRNDVEEQKSENSWKGDDTTCVLEERCKALASCTYEINTEWGKEVGLKYGFPSEDLVTGLEIQCRGWKSVYFNPERKAFVGVAPTTLLQALVQHTRWSEGLFKTALSKSCPFICGHKRIPLKLQLSYIFYFFWAPNSLPTLFYLVIPPLYLFRGISLFPEVSSVWILPFLYVIITQYMYSLGEFVICGGTLKGWWNDQRMWLFRRTTSYLIAFLETTMSQFGFSESKFIVTPKVADEDVLKRYREEIMEFGTHSPLFVILATIAMLNLFGLSWGVTMYLRNTALEPLAAQIALCGFVVLINLPVYHGLFFRRDKGKMPNSVTLKSVMLALLACTIALY